MFNGHDVVVLYCILFFGFVGIKKKKKKPIITTRIKTNMYINIFY